MLIVPLKRALPAAPLLLPVGPLLHAASASAAMRARGAIVRVALWARNASIETLPSCNGAMDETASGGAATGAASPYRTDFLLPPSPPPPCGEGRSAISSLPLAGRAGEGRIRFL